MAKKGKFVHIFGYTVQVGSKLWRWIKHYLQTHVIRTHVVMYDSVSVKNIPPKAKAVLGYVGGKWPTFSSGELAKAFPHALKMSIAIAASLRAKALDIERYDATPDQAPGWVVDERSVGNKHPVLYIAASGFQGLVDLMSSKGHTLGETYYVVTAHYTGKKHICGPKCGLGIKQSAHGTQWTDKAKGHNGALVDESYVQRRIFK